MAPDVPELGTQPSHQLPQLLLPCLLPPDGRGGFPPARPPRVRGGRRRPLPEVARPRVSTPPDRIRAGVLGRGRRREDRRPAGGSWASTTRLSVPRPRVAAPRERRSGGAGRCRADVGAGTSRIPAGLKVERMEKFSSDIGSNTGIQNSFKMQQNNMLRMVKPRAVFVCTRRRQTRCVVTK